MKSVPAQRLGYCETCKRKMRRARTHPECARTLRDLICDGCGATGTTIELWYSPESVPAHHESVPAPIAEVIPDPVLVPAHSETVRARRPYTGEGYGWGYDDEGRPYETDIL